jgi:hypothetical protein
VTSATKEAVLEEAITAIASRMLTLEQIKAAKDREIAEFEVPAWGGSVRYRGLSFDEMAVAREKSWDPKKKETNEDLLNSWIIALGLVEPKIDYEIAKDWICERSFGAVNSLLTEILTASGLGPRAQEAAKSTPED